MTKRKPAETGNEFNLDEFVATEEQLHAANLKVSTLERTLILERGAVAEVSRLNRELVDIQKRMDFLSEIKNTPIVRPKWAKPKPRGKDNRATVSVMLSDLHLDEVVNPDEIGGSNAYSRSIAEKRLKTLVDNILQMVDSEFSGLSLDGLEIIMGGDIVTGNLHDLAETNEDTVIGTCVYWVPILAEAIDRLSERFDNTVVRVFVGNHGRNTMKPRTKLRVRDNFDWLIGKMLQREFADDDSISFDIPETADVRHVLYDTHFLGTHGDQFRGGNGIAGIFSAVLHGQKKKLLRDAQLPDNVQFDVLYHGHFHQSYRTPGLIGNGAMKGYDEYAYLMNFPFEFPSQTLWLTTPQHGVTWVVPVYCSNRKLEKW